MTTSVELTRLQRAIFGDFDHECEGTRRMLERVPDDRLAWKPDPRSMSVGGLATHLANVFAWQFMIMESDEYDVMSRPHLEPDASVEKILARFDENAASSRAALQNADTAAFDAPWTLRRGDLVIFTRPRAAVLRNMGINHAIHHRGQLSVYLRLLHIPVPGMYGRSADEQ